MVKMNSCKAWLLATRPKTLTGAAAPVLVALSAAWADTGRLLWMPATLCMLFALLMQIDANFVNDYLDFQGGIDREDRLGPERACAQGWITPRAMRRGIALVTLLSCLTGLPLVLWGGWWMVAIGVACVLACFLYTTTLSRIALGDLLVVLFFGIVPVLATYYLQLSIFNFPLGSAAWPVQELSTFRSASPLGSSKNFQLSTFNSSLALGLVTDCLLLVNNYRDRDTDRRVGKRTLVVLIGPRATEWLYLALGLVAVALVLPQTLLPLLFLPLHLLNWIKIKRIHEGRALNKVLGKTAAAILLFALLYSAGRILGI